MESPEIDLTSRYLGQLPRQGSPIEEYERFYSEIETDLHNTYLNTAGNINNQVIDGLVSEGQITPEEKTEYQKWIMRAVDRIIGTMIIDPLDMIRNAREHKEIQQETQATDMIPLRQKEWLPKLLNPKYIINSTDGIIDSEISQNRAQNEALGISWERQTTQKKAQILNRLLAINNIVLSRLESVESPTSKD